MVHSRRSLAGLIAAVVALGARGPAVADLDAVVSFGHKNITPGAGSTWGWAFTLSRPVAVTELGLWDYGADGLAEAHHVSVWTSTGELRLSDWVAAGAEGTGDWQWTSTSPVILAPGEYVIGAYYGTNADFLAYNCNTIVTSAPDITWVRGRYGAAGDGFPDQSTPLPYWGYLGPNFRYRDADPVPEPALIQLPLLLGLGGVGLWWRRRP